MQQVPVTAVVGEKRGILSIDSSETVISCIQKLMQHDVRSAPVKQESQTLVFVDYVDLLDYLAALCTQRITNYDKLQEQLASLQQEFMNTPVSKVANFSKKDCFAMLKSSASIYDAATLLSKGNKRVMITDEQGNIVNIVSHSDLISLFRRFIDEQPQSELQSTTVQQLNLYEKVPTLATENMRAIDAFMTMHKEQSNFVPIVTEEKELISLISVRDLKVLGLQPDFNVLVIPVMDLVGLSRQASPDDKYPYIWCKQDASFDLVVKRLKATHVHRLVVIDDKKYPCGVITVQSLITGMLQ